MTSMTYGNENILRVHTSTLVNKNPKKEIDFSDYFDLDKQNLEKLFNFCNIFRFCKLLDIINCMATLTLSSQISVFFNKILK